MPSRRPVLEVGTDPDSPIIRVDGADVSGPIRTREVSNAVSAVASIPQVREYLIAQQRDIIGRAVGAGDGIVAEGRDIGSVVAPDAPVKVFLTATEEVRAQRRTADLTADPAATPAITLREQARRDRRDAPQMARAADAVEINATSLRLDEVIGEIVGLARERRTGSAWTT
jgi:cytidylate kinase